MWVVIPTYFRFFLVITINGVSFPVYASHRGQKLSDKKGHTSWKNPVSGSLTRPGGVAVAQNLFRSSWRR